MIGILDFSSVKWTKFEDLAERLMKKEVANKR